MKAMALSYDGQPSQVEVEIPKCRNPKQVRVQVQWSAIDTSVKEVLGKTWTGMFVHKKTNPLVLGWHFFGTVVECGSKVTTVKEADQVWGFLQYDPYQNQGSYAEYIVVPEDELALQPSTVEPRVLTAAATEAVTAYQALKLGNLESGQSVVVFGAGGGVGSAAVQIAKNMGAHVTAVCSTKDVKRVQDFGADKVIDRRATKDIYAELNRSYQVILDAPSMYSVRACLRKLDSKGTYVATLPSWGLVVGMIRTIFGGKSCKFIECHSSREDLDTIGNWLSKGSLKIAIDSEFPVKDLDKVLARQASPEKNGRVLVRVEGGW